MRPPEDATGSKLDTSAWSALYEQDFQPGTYIVEKEVAVEAGPSIGQYEDMIGLLSPGSVVNVVAVAHSQMRIRGRLENPAGWMSLVDTQDGYRWARRQPQHLARPGSPLLASARTTLLKEGSPEESQKKLAMRSTWRQALLEAALKRAEDAESAGDAAAEAVAKALEREGGMKARAKPRGLC